MKSPGPNSSRRKSIAILASGAARNRSSANPESDAFAGRARNRRTVLRGHYRKNREKLECCSKVKHPAHLVRPCGLAIPDGSLQAGARCCGFCGAGFLLLRSWNSRGALERAIRCAATLHILIG